MSKQHANTKTFSIGIEDLTAGGVTAFVSIAYSLSYAALIYSGSLSAGLDFGITASLLTAGITAMVVALGSTISTNIAGADSNASALMAAMAATLAVAVGASSGSDVGLGTVFVMLALCTLISGLVLLLIGLLKLGHWVRFVPYPVIGGFLLATGLLMIIGSLKLATGVSPLVDLAAYIGPAILPLAGAAIGFAILLAIAKARIPHFLTLPFMLVSGCLAGIALGPIYGANSAQLIELGWYFPAPEGGAWWQPFDFGTWTATNWPAIIGLSVQIFTVVAVTVLVVLLNTSGLEVVTREEADLNRELWVHGLANLASGAAGGFIGSVSVARSVLNAQAGASTKVAGTFAGILCLLMIFAGPFIVPLIPIPVFAGLLLFIGGQLVGEWVLAVRKRVNIPDHILIVAIGLIVVFWGFMPGLILGLLAAALIFVVNYAKVKAIRSSLTSKQASSPVERAPGEREILHEHGDLIRVLHLQGYLFFGTSDTLLAHVKSALAEMKNGFVILNFRQVTGLDTSAIQSFIRMVQLAEEHGAHILFTNLDPRIQKELQGERFIRKVGSRMHLEIPELADALEWCENQLVARFAHAKTGTRDLSDWLADELDSKDLAQRLMAQLQRLDLPAGQTFIEQGAPCDSMFFVKTGRVSIWLQPDAGKPGIRLRTMTRLTVVGEMGLLSGGTRGAAVITDEPSVIYKLDEVVLQEMAEKEPEIASALYRMLARLLTSRLAHANASISGLMD
jgi:SulP family sulfate permease